MLRIGSAAGPKPSYTPRVITLDALRTGFAQGEFFLEYLPTVSLADGRCTGAEALVRWNRPTGVLDAEDFIKVAQNTPFSGMLTYWVLDTVAAELGDWLRANPGGHIAINVPPEILGRGGMEYAASRSGLMDLARQIILEISERGVPDLLGIEAINYAWGLGFRLALDDVTLAGGANLAVLARGKFGIIKLDRSLVSQISAESSRPEWLGTVTALVQSSQLWVIAEGVETEFQRTALRQAGIQEAQGFYFSRAIRASAFIAYYHDGDRTKVASK